MDRSRNSFPNHREFETRATGEKKNCNSVKFPYPFPEGHGS